MSISIWNWDPLSVKPYRFMPKTNFDKLFWDFTSLEHVKNEDGSLSISIDVPGVKEEDLVVEVSPDLILSVKGQRKTPTSSYSISKEFSLPEGYDPDNVKADLKNGVLTLTLFSKVSVEKANRKVTITTEK